MLESRKRREHLSVDDLQKNKALLESFTKGGSIQGFDQNGIPVRRTSLSPPPDKSVSWEQYINSEVNNYPRLGRDLVYKESSKSFKATIAMVMFLRLQSWYYYLVLVFSFIILFYYSNLFNFYSINWFNCTKLTDYYHDIYWL